MLFEESHERDGASGRNFSAEKCSCSENTYVLPNVLCYNSTMSLFKKPYDFIAIGDIAVDAFIKLKDAHVNCKLNNEDCEICMKFGDKIPYEFDAIVPGVGNSANAAVVAARLGLRTAIIGNVG